MGELEAIRLVGAAYRTVLPPQMRDVISERLSPETRKGIKSKASWLMVPAERAGRARARRRLRRFNLATPRTRRVLADGRVAEVHNGLTDSLARELNHAAVATALSAWKIPHFTVPGLDDRRTVVAVAKENRARTHQALRALLTESSGYVEAVLPAPRRNAGPKPGSETASWRPLGKSNVIRVSWVRCDPTGHLVKAAEVGVDVEFWSRDGKQLRGPRQNRVMRLAPATAPTVSEPMHKFSGYADPARQRPRVLTHHGFGVPRVDEVAFAIDAVCLWSGPVRPSTVSDDIAEAMLRAALRSIHQHSPWVRTVHVVATAPVPDWVAREHERVRVVDASDLVDDAASGTDGMSDVDHRLHRIPDLSEQFLFLPAGSLLGRPLRKNSLFTPAGLAQYVAAPLRPGEATPAWMSLVARESGRAVSSGVFAGPQAFCVSVLTEVASWADEARAAGDAAPLAGLHHYWASNRTLERSARYAGVHLAARRLDVHLQRLRMRRDTDFLQFFGVDDAIVADGARDTVADFLAMYFPVPSPFERSGARELPGTGVTC
ncbi:hypothetical protein [Yinghuangia sp. YIM S09857]|uniref:hypothetical protein n=1 Tax=Yinghuangia sp. YIM S09857 TaxID=3436929 RepID=UPI003F52D99E